MVVTAPPPLPDSDHDVEGGVIEDARERQRRHRRLWALILGALATAALLGGLIDGGGGTGAAQRAAGRQPGAPGAGQTSARAQGVIAAPSPQGSGFGLMAPGVGWVMNSSNVYLTRNGGRSWKRQRVAVISAPDTELFSSSTRPRQLALSFAQGGQGPLTIPKWASAAQWDSQHVRGTISLTTDAGRTWRSRAFLPDISPGAVSFVGDRVGFALAYTPAAHHDPRASLYRTRDGARTWTRVAPVPFEGLISFADARHGLGGGWAVGAGLVDSAAIYRTNDGGRTWKRTSLCRPAIVYSCEASRLFASGRGVVLATARSQQTGRTSVVVYTTRDGGAHWIAHVLPGTPSLGNGDYVPLSAPSANDLFVWVSPYLYASTNGGRSWSRHAEPGLAIGTPGQFFSDIAFANGSYGWYADGPVFAYTTDGGLRWTRFADWR